MTVFSSGISMYAMARLLGILHIFDAPVLAMGLGPEYIFHFSVLLSAVIVLGYILLGGLSSAIYNEVLQFFLIVAGFLPLVLSRHARRRRLGRARARRCPTAFTCTCWRGMGAPETNPMGVEVVRPEHGARPSCCRSATGAPTSWSSSARWPPTR